MDPWSFGRHEATEKLLRIVFKECHTLLWSDLKIMLVVESVPMRHPTRLQLPHAHFFLQDMIDAIFWVTCLSSNLEPLQSAVYQYDIVNFSHLILRGNRFRAGSLIKKHWNLFNQFLTVAIEVTVRAYKRSMILVSVFFSHRQESNHRLIVFFCQVFIISEHDLFHMRSKKSLRVWFDTFLITKFTLNYITHIGKYQIIHFTTFLY